MVTAYSAAIPHFGSGPALHYIFSTVNTVIGLSCDDKHDLRRNLCVIILILQYMYDVVVKKVHVRYLIC